MMKFVAVALFFLSASAQASRVGLLRLATGAEARETNAHQSDLHRALFGEDFQFAIRQLLGASDMCMSMSMSMSMSMESDAPSDAPSDVPSDVPSQAPVAAVEAAEQPPATTPVDPAGASGEEFQSAKSGTESSGSSLAPNSGMSTGTTAMVAVLSVACVAVAAALVARKMHQNASSSASLADESAGSPEP